MKSYFLPSIVGSLFAALTLSLNATELPDKQLPIPAVEKQADVQYLQPRPLSSIPDGEFGNKVKLGYQLYVNSQSMRDKYVGNNQNCVNCHMGAGTKANAAPLWAAYMAYPAYRKKNDKVNSYEERIQGCFVYSMNGKAPPSGSQELVAMSAYSYWLAMSGLIDMYGEKGAPVPVLSDKELLMGGKRDEFILPGTAKTMTLAQRAKLPGRGYPKLTKPAQEPSLERGSAIYDQHCSTCHGVNGEGLDIAGNHSIPPLWGPNAFNWGAGMHRINTAAFFIKENMPLGKSIELSNQQAWDVAAFMNSHERPQDPRFTGDINETMESYHKHQGYYGRDTGNGEIGGSKAYPSANVK